MTVRELIADLSAYDPDLKVLIAEGPWDPTTTCVVEERGVRAVFIGQEEVERNAQWSMEELHRAGLTLLPEEWFTPLP